MARSKGLWTRNDLWTPKRRIEEMYRNAIRQAMRRIAGSLVGLDDPSDIIRALFNATQEPWFLEYAQSAAMQMVTHVFADTGKNWREAAAKNGQGRQIYEYLMKEMQGPLGVTVREMVERNAGFITRIPDAIAREMTQKVMELQMGGVRSSDIAQELMKLYPHMSDVKANLIARTEAAKTSSNLTQARSEIMGVQWYKWETSEDARVRESHRKMDQVLVAWDDPPSPEKLVHEKNVGHYHAGNIWNCRCFPAPVVDLDLIKWPAKVYRNGHIETMTRKQFERLLPRKREAV